jgi:hypothetical protein
MQGRIAKPHRLTAKRCEMVKMKITLCYLSWIAIVIYFYAGSAYGSEWKDKGEAEGKVTWYASLSATDARRIIDRFKELYPKIDAQFYRAGDAAVNGAQHGGKGARENLTGT